MPEEDNPENQEPPIDPIKDLTLDLVSNHLAPVELGGGNPLSLLAAFAEAHPDNKFVLRLMEDIVQEQKDTWIKINELLAKAAEEEKGKQQP